MLPQVGMGRFELPKTSCLSDRRSKPTELHPANRLCQCPKYINGETRTLNEALRLHRGVSTVHVVQYPVTTAHWGLEPLYRPI